MVSKKFISVSAPSLVGNEKKYVNDCLDTTWISSNGKYIDLFESHFASFCNVKHAISCSNGTVALHLALMAFDTKPGDEIIVPTLTFVATANAVMYCGATPVFADSEPETWNIDPATVEQLITARTKGIIVVSLYGHPVDMDPIIEIARRHNLFVIEDAAESVGSEYKGRKTGSIADITTFSLFGNKIITSGEGGMVVTDNSDLSNKIRLLKGQGQDPQKRYWHVIVGYNYRMTNIEAAIGLAQLEKIDWHLARRREIAMWYYECLKDVHEICLPAEKNWAKNVYWMFSVILNKKVPVSREQVMKTLLEKGIETRPLFYPMHVLPPYKLANAGRSYPVAEYLSSNGINLPTWGGLEHNDIEYVCDSLKECIVKR